MALKKVLIIGGNGFIGKNLLKEMVKNDSLEIYSFDLSYPDEQIKGVSYMTGDFFDDYVLGRIVDNKDIIIHAISTVNPGNSNDKYMQGYERDFIQTIKLCELVMRQNARMIFLSSGGTVYGVQQFQPIKENALPLPINHYGNVKLCIENTIRTFNRQRNADMIIVRISNPYGPGQNYLKGVGFIDATLKRAISGETVYVWGDGNIIRDYIYISDVCKMIVSLLFYDGKTEVFNISTGMGVSQNQIIEIIGTITQNEIKVVYTPARKVDLVKVVLDNTKIMKICPINVKKIDVGIQMYYEYLKRVSLIEKDVIIC